MVAAFVSAVDDLLHEASFLIPYRRQYTNNKTYENLAVGSVKTIASLVCGINRNSVKIKTHGSW